MSKKIEKLDGRGNLIYFKNAEGKEYWYEYDDNDNEIHYKNSVGLEYWCEYNEHNKLIHYKDDGGEEHFKWDDLGNQIEITKQEFEQIKEIEFLSREPVMRFELMDI